MTRKEEKLLLNALGNSDRRAFAVLYNLYAGKCLHFVTSVLKDDEVSKDITHDIFVKVWLKRDLISKVDSFSSYLFKMVRNAVMDSLESVVIRRRFIVESLVVSEEFCSYVDGGRVAMTDIVFPTQPYSQFSIECLSGESLMEGLRLYGLK